MQFLENNFQLSASDLMRHLSCRHSTSLDIQVAQGLRKKPTVNDPALDVLIERGRLHEKAYFDHLTQSGLSVTDIPGTGMDEEAVTATLAALKSGVSVIAQAAFKSGTWGGRADILLRVEKPSSLGSWSYEAVDTKLAQTTKGSTLIQLCLYSEMLGDIQGVVPDYAHVVTPETGYQKQSYRIADYSAYYRHIKRKLEGVIAEAIPQKTYPEPVPYCDVCRWRLECNAKRRQDDHLSFVAGISTTQRAELATHGVTTTLGLSKVDLPLPWKPERGAVKSYERIREQARIQIAGKASGKTTYELLPIQDSFGLCALPLPSQGDIFLDLEGDPFVPGGGREFLFGYVFTKDDGTWECQSDWALTAADEKSVFERFIDFVTERVERHPDLHIYHFAPYEPAALKRLMGRYATREKEVDDILRAKLFVDLYAVIRHGIRASVESYSIKKLEPLYNYTREAALPEVGPIMAKVQACIELNDLDGISVEDRKLVTTYNYDDCASTRHLRDWLETLRYEAAQDGQTLSRPDPNTNRASEEVTENQKKMDDLVKRLVVGIPVDVTERTKEQQAKWILANILDWHRREKKSQWWEYFRLCDLSNEDLLDEKSALSGLEFVGEVPREKGRVPIHRYSFPLQETDLKEGDNLRTTGGISVGSVYALSQEDRTVDIKKAEKTANLHPVGIFSYTDVPTDVLAAALFKLGTHVADNGFTKDGEFNTAIEILLNVAPKLDGKFLTDVRPVGARHDSDFGISIAHQIGDLVLPIQGPPGTGKTYTGARMINELVAAGKKVGITALSHKVISNLVSETFRAADEAGLSVSCVQMNRGEKSDRKDLIYAKDNADFFMKLETSGIGAGTQFLWAREEALASVDVMFVDEAAQMSLANVLAIAGAAKSIVLLGDPQQLEQPMKGSHPDGTDVSALDYILDGHQTIPADKGLFLEETWRLHPDICSFTSEMFYEDRLLPKPGLGCQAIKSNGRVSGSGLRIFPVPHTGNQNNSPEEAEAVAQLVREILESNSTWVNRDGTEKAITHDDILIITPYNAQVFELQRHLPGYRIGTVDKFQGQEAPIAIYSMATSTYADAPRGMEFLYSANRLNVASSRAKCLFILVSSPEVFEAECRTPHQMQLANAFCRFKELAITGLAG